MRATFYIPLIAFLGLAAALGIGLTMNMRLLPSALIGRSVPTFNLPPVPGVRPALSSANLKAGKVVLVNIFASWCVSCREEHPILMALAKEHLVPIYGIAYKDTPKATATYLANNGDPYQRIGEDETGRVGINWGVYGVPETYVITKTGKIAYKVVGPISAAILTQKVLPLVRKLEAKP